jgi:hypothetical protein
VDNAYKNMLVVFAGGTAANVKVARKVTGYSGASRQFTLDQPFPATPAVSDTYYVIGYGG